MYKRQGYWSIQVIAIPIFIPLALSMGVNPSLAIAAVMSGIVFGCNICFYVDTVFMTSAGTGVSNLRQIKVTAPYAIAGAVLTVDVYKRQQHTEPMLLQQESRIICRQYPVS